METQLTTTTSKAVAKAVRMPVIYEEAVRDLIACQTLDEAMYFADKAEALAAWAKIYKNDQVGVEAKRLKLHAYRRMGELSAELSPKRIGRQKSGEGPFQLLMRNGLSVQNAKSARTLALMRPETFQALVQLPRPPSPGTVKNVDRTSPDPLVHLRFNLSSLRSRLRSQNPVELAALLHQSPRHAQWFRDMAVEISEWLDRFERHLPK